MTALARRRDAATTSVASPSTGTHALWLEAVHIRQEWLDHGLSTLPADRPTAEGGITALYARIGRPPPRFEWVDSPLKALPLIGGLPTLDDLYTWIRDPRPPGLPPLASDLATEASRLRAALGAGVWHTDPEQTPVRRGKKKERWPELSPPEAVAAGMPVGVLVHQGVRNALHRSLLHGFCRPVRAALAEHGPVPVCWYGQQDASWLAYYLALSRLGLARYGPDETRHLGHWAGLARSCGWWWPGERVCVVVDRPDAVRVEGVPGGHHGEVRVPPGGVRYRDGWRP
jgi:hypothetical protein